MKKEDNGVQKIIKKKETKETITIKMKNISKFKRIRRSKREKRNHIVRYEESADMARYLKKHNLSKQKISDWRKQLKYDRTDEANKLIRIAIKTEKENRRLKKMKKKKKKSMIKPTLSPLN